MTITVSSDTSGGLYTTSDSSGNGGLFGCINAYRGQTLTIDVVGSSADLQSHPLQITNYNDLGQAMGPLSGVQKTQYGDEYTLTWTVPCDETVTKYQYQCSNHSSMRGTINVLGSCGDNTTNIESYLGSLDTHIIPDTNAAYDLGTAEKKFRHLYLSSNTLYMGDDNTPIRLDSNKKLLVDDVEVGGAIASYVNSELPTVATNGTIALDTDNNSPVYFMNGKWKKLSDDTDVADNRTELEVYLLAGQSNAGGTAPDTDFSAFTQVDGEGTLSDTRGQILFSSNSDSDYDNTPAILNPGGNHGVELSFLDKIDNIREKKQLLVKYFSGGSAIETWEKDTGANNNWDKMT